MRTILAKLLLVCSLLAGLAVSANAAVTFTLTPSAVSNTYSGKLTLVVGNLPNGASAVVQKFLDLDANGVLDGADMLLQQFTLTDGEAGMLIGGVTNLNVPGDTDSTAGQITAKVPFPDGDFAQTIVGNYLFVLSSPTGAFAPLTNSFAVTNVPFAQALAGSVVENGLNVPGAVVVVFPPPTSAGHGMPDPVAAAVTDPSGNYTIPLPPGTYLPVALGNNAVADASASPLVSLSTGQTLTNDLMLTNATALITGQVVDDNNPSVGLPGLFLPLSTKTGLLATGSTDTNGNFSVGVLPGTWKFEGEPQGLILHGYVGFQGGTNVSAGSSFTGGFPRANALFYGQVMDGFGKPIPSLDISAEDNNGQFQSDGYTDNEGYYSVGALGGLGGDTWFLFVDNSPDGANPRNYIFSQPLFDQNGGTNLNLDQALQVNFTALLATNYISGNVQFDGTNVVGVGVSANATINGLNYSIFADTDTNGNYVLQLANGNWSVGVNCNGGGDSLDSLLGPGNYQCPDNQNVTLNNNNGLANFMVQPPGGGPLEISAAPLPNGNVGVNYSSQLQASGGTPPYSWLLPLGSEPLPPGLSLETNGEISGLPTTNGLFYFIVQVRDATFNYRDQSLGLLINPRPVLSGPLGFTNGRFQFLLTGGSNQNYTVQVCTNLASPNWVSLYVTNNPATNSFLVADPNPASPQRFYRVLVGP